MAVQTLSPSITPEANFSRYLQDIRKFPMLSHELEIELARRWRDEKDPEAAHQLVNSHLRLVAKIAMKYRGYGLPMADLISEGNIGLMKAVRKFEPERGFRLSTYAMWWIRATIQEYILHSWSLVKLGTTASQKKLFFNLRKLKAQMKAINDGDMTPEQVSTIAEKLKVSENDVVMMNRRMAKPDNSLNARVGEDGDLEWQDWLVDDTADQETDFGRNEELVYRRELLGSAMSGLKERERHILSERRLKDQPATLEVLSQHYGISRERVRQIEVSAFEKLQKSMKNAVIGQRLAN